MFCFVIMIQIYCAGIISVKYIQILADLRQFYLILNLQYVVVSVCQKSSTSLIGVISLLYRYSMM